MPQRLCGEFARVDIATPAVTYLAVVANETQGLRFPRRILELASDCYWTIDMKSWKPLWGRLLEMFLPASGVVPAIL